MKTKTCPQCGGAFKRRTKRKGRLAILPQPDCGRCWVHISKVQGYGTALAFSCLKIID